MENGQRSRQVSSATLGLAVVAVVALGAVVATRGSLDVGAKPTNTPVAVESVAASAAPSPATTPAAPTAEPSFGGLVGVYPGPDATLPPNAPALIPGVHVVDFAVAAQKLGLTCESEAGTYQEGSGGYTLSCEGADHGGHAMFALSVTYWTLDGASEVLLSAYPDGPGSAVSPGAPIKLMQAVSTLSSGDVAQTWVTSHLDDTGCRDTCTRTEGAIRLELQVGDNGGRQLHVIAAAG